MINPSKSSIKTLPKVAGGMDFWRSYMCFKVSSTRFLGTDGKLNQDICSGVRGKGIEIGLMFYVKNEQKEDYLKYPLIDNITKYGMRL